MNELGLPHFGNLHNLLATKLPIEAIDQSPQGLCSRRLTQISPSDIAGNWW